MGMYQLDLFVPKPSESGFGKSSAEKLPSAGRGPFARRTNPYEFEITGEEVIYQESCIRAFFVIQDDIYHETKKAGCWDILTKVNRPQSSSTRKGVSYHMDLLHHRGTLGNYSNTQASAALREIQPPARIPLGFQQRHGAAKSRFLQDKAAKASRIIYWILSALCSYAIGSPYMELSEFHRM